jgi:type I restriction enzyme S subunit
MQNGRLDLSSARLISQEHFVEWTRKAKPIDHDVIVSRRCNPGETAVAAPGMQFALGQNLVLLRADGTRIHPPFLRWLLRGPEWQSQVGKFLNVGAVFDSLRCADIPNFELTIPSMSDQKRIAHILGTLDDKIELNQQMAATQDEMARAIYKSWFIDFEPVRAKAEGRPTNLPPEIDALLPNKFNNEGTPLGWQLRPLDSLGTFLNGLALQKYPPVTEHTLPVIKIAQLRKMSTFDADRCGDNLPEEYVVKDGDLLFSWSGSLECVVWTGGCGGLNQHLFKVTSEEVPAWFLYFAIQEHLPWFRTIAASKATTMGHIQRKHLNESTIGYDPNFVTASNALIAPLFQRMWNLQQECKRLMAVRDSLLKTLMSGQAISST